MPKAFSYRLRLSGNFIRTFNIVMLNCIVMRGVVAQSFGAGEVRRTARRVLKGEETNQGEEDTFKANMLLPVSAGEEGRKLGITLSGSSTGQCTVNGDCFSSLNYVNSERCTFTMGEDGALNVISFVTESGFDKLTVGGIQYDGTTGPEGISVSAGEEITWYSDEIETREGFEICVVYPCVASTTPSDDGSDGNFYCINGGDVGGWWDEDGSSCTCTCNTGFGGPNCAICATGYSGSPHDECSPDPCLATSTSTDNGSEGNFYCINGGYISGTTGSCSCSCKAGFAGDSCQSPANKVASMNGIFNTVSNYMSSHVSTGNSTMADGDVVVIAVGVYKCSEGTCATGATMLWVYDLFGEVRCKKDTPDKCVFDGEYTRRGLKISGTGGGKLTFRALSIVQGKASYGGAMSIFNGAIVDINLCIFTGCRATNDDWGGGAFYVQGTTINAFGCSFNENTADSGKGDDIYNDPMEPATITIYDTCPSPYFSHAPVQGNELSTFSDVSGSSHSFSCHYTCDAGYHNADGGFNSSACESCSVGKTSHQGSRTCFNVWQVSDMTELFNKVSNAPKELPEVDNTGTFVMDNGEIVVLAIGLYKCSEGTCAGNSHNMLYTQGLNGLVKCVEDNASCHLDGEQAIRLMSVDGTGGGKLTLRALGFVGGKASEGGGVNVREGGIVDIELCLFLNCKAERSSLGGLVEFGGGAIRVDSSGTYVNIYGTSFHGNSANGVGGDIYRYSGAINIHNTCPPPYSSTTPIQGKTRTLYQGFNYVQIT